MGRSASSALNDCRSIPSNVVRYRVYGLYFIDSRTPTCYTSNAMQTNIRSTMTVYHVATAAIPFAASLRMRRTEKD